MQSYLRILSPINPPRDSLSDKTIKKDWLHNSQNTYRAKFDIFTLSRREFSLFFAVTRPVMKFL